MKENVEHCRYEAVYSLQFQNLRDDLNELKERVRSLETTLGRGVTLLLANLVGVVITLAEQILK